MVRNWIAAPPPWVDVRPTSHLHDASLSRPDGGEEAAIALAVELHADLLLMDDEEGVIAARGKGLEVIRTLGVMRRPSQRHLLDLGAFDRVKRTNFRFRQEIMDHFLAGQGGRG